MCVAGLERIALGGFSLCKWIAHGLWIAKSRLQNHFFEIFFSFIPIYWSIRGTPHKISFNYFLFEDTPRYNSVNVSFFVSFIVHLAYENDRSSVNGNTFTFTFTAPFPTHLPGEY